MLVLGIESSCDETGLALYDTQRGCSRTRSTRRSPCTANTAASCPSRIARPHPPRAAAARGSDGAKRHAPRRHRRDRVHAGPGLAGALLVGASIANALALARNKPTVGIHHLEGHLLSPLLVDQPPPFPFVALLVSGGHTQLMRVTDVGVYETLGETLDDAAGEAFDKTAKLIGLGYPGGPEVSKLAETGTPGAVVLPRPMLHSGDLDFSFSGLKTAVLTQMKRFEAAKLEGEALERAKADLARGFVDAAVDVLVAVARRAEEDEAQAPRGRGRGRREPPASRRAVGRGSQARLRRALPRSRALHRQRRDDRAGRRVAARPLARAGECRLRIHGEAALGSRVARALSRAAHATQRRTGRKAAQF